MLRARVLALLVASPVYRACPDDAMLSLCPVEIKSGCVSDANAAAGCSYWAGAAATSPRVCLGYHRGRSSGPMQADLSIYARRTALSA